MLTTIDNPHDPFTNYDAWNSFDIAAGYHTSELLARIVKTSPHLSEADTDMAVEEAIDEIVRENLSGMFRKVIKEV